MPEKPVISALKLLADEREALRKGQLSAVAALAGQKEALVRDIAQMKLSAKDSEKLRVHAEENARLFEAAISGLREAQKRLAALQAVRSGLNIYTAAGGRETVAKSSGALEHKV